MLERRNNAENQAHQRAQRHRLTADLDGNRQTGLDELADGGIFTDCVADTEITPAQVGNILTELHDDGLVQTVLFVQHGPLVVGQLFIVEGRAGHQLQQDKQHQRDGQQGEYGNQNTFCDIFLHVWFLLSFAKGESN